MKSANENLEIARIRKEISRGLDLSLDHLIFDFSQEGDVMKLDLITLNPKHDQTFLFYSVTGKDKVEALDAVLKYVNKTHKKERSYTVQWSVKGTSELHTSYFRARDMFEVLDKFSHGRDIEAYIIFSIILNPIA